MLNDSSQTTTKTARPEGEAYLKIFMVLTLLLFAFCPSLFAYEHPGGMHLKQQIEFVRKQIAEKNEPYTTAFNKLIEVTDSAFIMPHHALADFSVPGYYVKPEEHEKNSLSLAQDAFNAYACALAWQLTLHPKYAERAIYFINAWSSTNKGYSADDGPLVMSYTGTAMVMAAELLTDCPVWKNQDKQLFTSWLKNIYQKATNEIRTRKNNWGDWGRFGSSLAAYYLNDVQEMNENVRLLKSDIFNKIDDDGHMPEETRRGANGIWYTYFSLAPITATLWVAYNSTGENLFGLQHDGRRSLKGALDYLLYYNQYPQAWKWFAKPVQGVPGKNIHSDPSWPFDLFEAMLGIYSDPEYAKYVLANRPICYVNHHYAWCFPTLMPARLNDYQPKETSNHTPTSVAEAKQWITRHFAKGVVPPFSFVYGEKKSDSFITGWLYKSEVLKPTEPDTELSAFTYTDPKTGLAVKCTVTCFTDYPAVEWVLKMTNTSGKKSPIIEKACAVDYAFVSDVKGEFILHHSNGSNGYRDDFKPMDDYLAVGESKYITPIGGRSSGTLALPFFNIEMPWQQGIIVGIGWTGKWYADIQKKDAKTVELKSGMERMQLALLPNEDIRTPRICLFFWKGGDRMAGHNQFRRFIMAHHSPKIDGCLAQPPLSAGFDWGDPKPCEEYTCLTEDYAVSLVKRFQQFKILPEVFWLDCGWFSGCGWDKQKGGCWHNVGNWTADPKRFPHGLRPVADAIHQAGSKFMVWFEPERVHEFSMIYKEHPEWLLRREGDDNSLFDLGNKDACKWMIDYISDLIRKEGIDYYRQDDNVDPMNYWACNDTPGRIGIHEIKHVEGLYAFWDSLLVRFPRLLIDNCAGGGQRLDLEATSRSIPLWRSDYSYGEPNGTQGHAFGLNFYLPFHGTGMWKTDDYTFRSSLGAAAVMSWEITGKESEQIPDIQKRISDFKNLRPYFYGDYYPMTESWNCDTSDRSWLSYQLNRPDEHDGIILAFRRKDCENESIRIKPRGLESNTIYELFYEDYKIRINKTGQEIMEGIDLAIPQPQQSLLVSYRKKE